MFCPNCGTQFDDTAAACPTCGTVVTESQPQQPEGFAPAKAGNKNKLFLLIGGIAALVLVIVLVFVLFGGGADSTAESYVAAVLQDGDYIDAAGYTTADLDFDAVYAIAKPLDRDDFDDDNDTDKAMRKAIDEAGTSDLEEVYPLFLEYLHEENMIDNDGYESEVCDIEVGSSEEISVNDKYFVEQLKEYNTQVENYAKSYKEIASTLRDCVIDKADITAVQKVYVLYNIDTTEPGEDEAECQSFYVVKHDGSWKVLDYEVAFRIFRFVDVD